MTRQDKIELVELLTEVVEDVFERKFGPAFDAAFERSFQPAFDGSFELHALAIQQDFNAIHNRFDKLRIIST